MDVVEGTLADLLKEQEADELDDGFPYEHIGGEANLERGETGWITPTAFMIVSLKELLRALISVYGWSGHSFLREIGKDNLRDMDFINGLGLGTFLRLQQQAMNALPHDEQKRLGFIE